MNTLLYISPAWILFLLQSSLLVRVPAAVAQEQLGEILDKIESDTLAFASKVEELILDKCASIISDEKCSKSSYHRCASEFPSAECPGGEGAIAACGSGKKSGCGGLFDFTTSAVSTPTQVSDNSISPDRIKDGVCSTLGVEEYMIQFSKSTESYWGSLNILPPWLYYGTDDGVFRMFPGSPGSTCGENNYDPRLRSWYISASSGPKDVILVLDISNSMRNNKRMRIMQDAAKRVVNTLGISDYFAVIKFNNLAENLTNNTPFMMRANDKNKEEMVQKIDDLVPSNTTDVYAGFELAFDTLTNSIQNDMTSGCNRAILFLSDGYSNKRKEALIDLTQSKRENYIQENENPPVLFTYSFGEDTDDSVSKKIACENDGIFAKISDGGDLAKSMGAYYKYFAHGLSDESNKGFVSWVDPYEFSTGVGLGTTASAPVYDRSVDPPILAGVVGMDLSYAALGSVLRMRRMEILEGDLRTELIKRSGETCPNLSLDHCQLESLRKYGSDDTGNENTLCSDNCSEIKPLKASLCDNYPDDLWNNTFNQGRSYEERTCCKVGEVPRTINNMTDQEIKNGMCTEVSLSFNYILVKIIEGFVISAVIILGLGLFWLFQSKRKKSGKGSSSSTVAVEEEEEIRNRGFHNTAFANSMPSESF